MNAAASRSIPDSAELAHPETRTALRRLTLLVRGYLAVSVVTLAAVALLRNHSGVVNSAVWIRGTIVVISAMVTTALAARTARGSRGAYRRLRIISAVTVVAIVAIIAAPGPFPLWMKADQAVCGLVLIGVAAVANGARMRSLFSDSAADRV
ncbi:hypothetical protein [Streptacidiphilus carbonis]|jgi:peptidoglycan/LPS O-acetylase OafA/YrhL|uniref:hypothetical protein n=1 Tax=Streptacidiphilus carbonis TaxID=105422 RepID=UPI0005A921C6|nr:hypothetical protein [Streptacidiphilus carbonis]